jgi:uncharacterized membrane protein
MLVLVLGLVLFLGTHSLMMTAPRLRDEVVARRGVGAWKLPYTFASVLGLVLIVWGYGLARQEPVLLYSPPLGMRHVALALMLPVFPLLFASHMPGRIKATVRHPMLLGTILWGTAHLLANGMLADVLLFGGFAGWAALDWLSAARRPNKPVTSRAPSAMNDGIAVIGGLIVYGIFMGGLHRLLFGVSPV